eukprot:763571-Hanusia_phi.AAC.2
MTRNRRETRYQGWNHLLKDPVHDYPYPSRRGWGRRPGFGSSDSEGLTGRYWARSPGRACGFGWGGWYVPYAGG